MFFFQIPLTVFSAWALGDAMTFCGTENEFPVQSLTFFCPQILNPGLQYRTCSCVRVFFETTTSSAVRPKYPSF